MHEGSPARAGCFLVTLLAPHRRPARPPSRRGLATLRPRRAARAGVRALDHAAGPARRPWPLRAGQRCAVHPARAHRATTCSARPRSPSRIRRTASRPPQRLRRGLVDHFDLEKRYVRADGSTVWCQATSTPINVDGHEPCRYVQIVDITTAQGGRGADRRAPARARGRGARGAGRRRGRGARRGVPLVAQQVAALLDADAGAVIRFDAADDTGTCLATWAAPGCSAVPPGTTYALTEDSAAVACTAPATRPATTATTRPTAGSAPTWPATARAPAWRRRSTSTAGCGARSPRPRARPAALPEDAARSASSASPSSSAWPSRNAEARAAPGRPGVHRSADRACQPPHVPRARCATRSTRRARPRAPLALVLFDLDHFKAGQRHPRATAPATGCSARSRGRLARPRAPATRWAASAARSSPGSCPDRRRDGASAAAEHARAHVAARAVRRRAALTISAGICDLGRPAAPPELCALADGALYWAKAHGRNTRVGVLAETVEELSAAERGRAPRAPRRP